MANSVGLLATIPPSTKIFEIKGSDVKGLGTGAVDGSVALGEAEFSFE